MQIVINADKTKLNKCQLILPEFGAQNYAIVTSITQKAIKNRQNPFEVLLFISTLAQA